ncbi:hypothetical protein HJFPF1_05670 [Paramyrothecium foliicola]|nr:hypothetical protein HJFPF1_05670 [Paramyrothecium foliicola]
MDKNGSLTSEGVVRKALEKKSVYAADSRDVVGDTEMAARVVRVSFTAANKEIYDTASGPAFATNTADYQHKTQCNCNNSDSDDLFL